MADQQERADAPGHVQTIWPRAWADFWRRKEKSQVGVVVAIVAALVALVRYHGDQWWQTALWTVGGVAVGFAATYLFVLGWCVLMAAAAQRDDARATALRLQAELDEKATPRFTVEARIERLSPLVQFDIDEGTGATIHYSELTALWVQVKNTGPSGVFVARVVGLGGPPVPSGYTGIEDVAWENTIEPSREIARGGTSRLLLGMYARMPDTPLGVYAPCFWFWAARSAIWAPSGHAFGWRLRNLAGQTIVFGLEVVNTTFDKSDYWSGRVIFPGASGEPEFDLVQE